MEIKSQKSVQNNISPIEKQPEATFSNRIAPQLFNGRTLIENPKLTSLSRFEAASIAHSLKLSTFEILGVFFNFDNVIEKVNDLFTQEATNIRELEHTKLFDEIQRKAEAKKDEVDRTVINALADKDLGPITKMKLKKVQNSVFSFVHQWSDRNLQLYKNSIDDVIKEGTNIQKLRYQRETRSSAEMRQTLEGLADELRKKLEPINNKARWDRKSENESMFQTDASRILSEIEEVLKLNQRTDQNVQVIAKDLGAYLDNINKQIKNLPPV